MPKLTKNPKSQTAAEIYTELVIADGFPVRAVAKSKYIQRSIARDGLIPINSPNRVMDKVHQEIEKEMKNTKEEYNKAINEQKKRFSLTFDEYTSIKNRRSLTINVHNAEGKSQSLGMVRVWGSQTADSILKLVKGRLEKFGIDLKTIVSVTTDGASIMIKLGKIVNTIHQVCLAHGIHLAVTARRAVLMMTRMELEVIMMEQREASQPPVDAFLVEVLGQ